MVSEHFLPPQLKVSVQGLDGPEEGVLTQVAAEAEAEGG
jgi:hypothetical protein